MDRSEAERRAQETCVDIFQRLKPFFPHQAWAALAQLTGKRPNLDIWNRVAAAGHALNAVPGEFLTEGHRRIRVLIGGAAMNLPRAAATLHWREDDGIHGVQLCLDEYARALTFL